MHTFISNNKKKERRTNMESNKNNVSFVTGVHTHDTTRGGGAKPVVIKKIPHVFVASTSLIMQGLTAIHT